MRAALEWHTSGRVAQCPNGTVLQALCKSSCARVCFNEAWLAQKGPHPRAVLCEVLAAEPPLPYWATRPACNPKAPWTPAPACEWRRRPWLMGCDSRCNRNQGRPRQASIHGGGIRHGARSRGSPCSARAAAEPHLPPCRQRARRPTRPRFRPHSAHPGRTEQVAHLPDC